MQENTQVNLEVQPQVKGPLPEVRLSPAEKRSEEKLSELLVHLVLQKYNKLLAKAQALKNKYSDKEQNKAQLAELKNQNLERVKELTVKLDEKIKFSAKTAPLQKYLHRTFWAGKIAELREESRKIRLKLNKALASAIKSQMDKKPSGGIIQS